MESGYKVIDVKGANVISNGPAVTVTGVYERIESSLKTILVTNLLVDGVDIKPTFINVVASGTSYTATLLSALNSSSSTLTVYAIIFDDDDGISVQSKQFAAI